MSFHRLIQGAIWIASTDPKNFWCPRTKQCTSFAENIWTFPILDAADYQATAGQVEIRPWWLTDNCIVTPGGPDMLDGTTKPATPFHGVWQTIGLQFIRTAEKGVFKEARHQAGKFLPKNGVMTVYLSAAAVELHNYRGSACRCEPWGKRKAIIRSLDDVEAVTPHTRLPSGVSRGDHMTDFWQRNQARKLYACTRNIIVIHRNECNSI
jgi:hypothetical protein